MQLNCSKCSTPILAENVNIATDLAKCEACGSILKASELTPILERKDYTPPSGSKITLSKQMDGTVELVFPKKGFTLFSFGPLFFALFWLGFVSFWTWGAAQGSIFFALFSIPFWLVGIGMVIGIINNANEKQIIRLNRQKLEFHRRRPIWSKSFETELKHIQTIKLTAVKMNPFSSVSNINQLSRFQGSFGAAPLLPAIITGQKTEYFFEGANDAEQEWVTRALDNLVKERK